MEVYIFMHLKGMFNYAAE